MLDDSEIARLRASVIKASKGAGTVEYVGGPLEGIIVNHDPIEGVAVIWSAESREHGFIQVVYVADGEGVLVFKEYKGPGRAAFPSA